MARTDPTMRLSVILVNYNTTGLAEACLRSMREHLRLDGVEVILVDNASTDFDPAPLQRAWPGLTVVESPDNVGFGRGNNLGARFASGEYFWLLNTDTLVPPDHHLDDVLGFLDGHPRYAAALPLLVNADGRVQPWQTGYFPSLWRMVVSVPARAAIRIAPATARALRCVDTNFRPVEEADVDHVVAAAMVIRRAAYEEVGGFSPEYFFYLEDTDLCRKLRARGWHIRWLPQSRIIHLWSGSMADPVRRQRLFFAAQEIYFRRWHSRGTLWALRLVRLPLYLRLGWCALKGRRLADIPRLHRHPGTVDDN
jgi:GT2 family glycosyltransferase